MYIVTWNLDLLAVNQSGKTLTQVRSMTPPGGLQLVDIDPAEVSRLEDAWPRQGEIGVDISSGPLAGCRYVKAARLGFFHLFNGKFACAEPNNVPVVWDRERAGPWETFHFMPPGVAEAFANTPRDADQALQLRVQSLIAECKPVCLHFGCGYNLIKGFLNIDYNIQLGPFGQLEDCYQLDFTQKPWPLSDSSVDYIYSEDFIEHVPQRSQVAFLAEAFRVLKPGGYNRVSTPSLIGSMQAMSDFTRGIKGVYFGEFDKWGHVALFTKGFVTELAQAIGYSKVIFSEKSHGSSPYAVPDRRPGGDRPWEDANIFADLRK